MDGALVHRAQQGDQRAFMALVDRMGGRLHALAYTVLRDRELARDVTQQTLLWAWRDLPRLHDPERFEAWVCRILVRTCRHEARRATRWLPSTACPGPEPSAPDELAVIVDRDEIERAFRHLSVDQRAVVVLTYYFDLPPHDVATILDVPIGTVSSRLHRALRLMHAALDADARPVLGGPVRASVADGPLPTFDGRPGRETRR